MPYVLYCRDKPDSTQLRLENRAAHLEFAQSWGDAVALAGPLLEDPTTETNDVADQTPKMIGSLIVLNLDTRAEVDRFIACDPYGIAGLFESVTVHGYKIALTNL